MHKFKTILEAIGKSILCVVVFTLSLYFVPLLQMFWANTGIIDAGFDFVEEYQKTSQYAVVGEAKLRVEIADNYSEREKGLSNRYELEEGTGMFFIFPEVGYHGIWMKDMNFPIDIIWFDVSMKVVHLEENVSPSTYPNSFKPDSKSKYVLEVPAGFIKKEGIKISDWITIL